MALSATPRTPPSNILSPPASPARLIWLLIVTTSFIIWLFALLGRLNFFQQNVTARLAYPFFQSGSEGLIMAESALIHQGQSLYLPFRADSFISAPYPPLYYYLVAGWWSDNANLFLNGRLISLYSAMATAGLVAWSCWLARPVMTAHSNLKVLRLEGIYRLVLIATGAILSGLVFLSFPAVTIWAGRVRADMLMTALGVAGLAFTLLSVRTHYEWLSWVGVICFALAFYTKQTALAAPVAAGIYLAVCYGEQWGKTLRWLVAMALTIGVPFIVFNLATNLELYRRLFKYHNLPWQVANFREYATLFWQESAGAFLAGLGLLVMTLFSFGYQFLQKKPKGLERWLAAARQIPLAGWYLAGSLALLLGLGVSGADHNHFLPAQAALVMAGGSLLVQLLARQDNWHWLAPAIIALLIWQTAVNSLPPARYGGELTVQDATYRTQMEKIINYIGSRPGAILSSEAGFYLLAHKENQLPYYNDLFTLAALDKQGLYSREGLFDAIRRKQFAFVVSEGDIFNGKSRLDVWTPELVALLQENYYRKFSDIWYVYEPKTDS